jgi:hypothetical protein
LAYVDRIVGPQFETFETLLDTRLLGSTFVELKSHLKYSLNEALGRHADRHDA